MRTTVEKVEDYLKEHKNEYSVKQIAEYFLMSEAAIYFACKTLMKKGAIIRTKKTVPSGKLNRSMAFFYQHKNHITKPAVKGTGEIQESFVKTILENITVTWQFRGKDIITKKFDAMEKVIDYLEETQLEAHPNLKALVVTANKKRETLMTLRVI